jgi:antitoxin HicB
MKTTPTETHPTQNDHNSSMISSYPVEVSPLSEEEGGGFQALFPPLARSVVGYGMTTQEAIDDLQGMVPSLLELMAETEQALPEVVAEKDWDDFSGKFNVRVAKVLHAQLVELAEDQGVSLNSLVQTVLASGATALAAGKMFGALERPNVKTQSPYQWEEESVPILKMWSDESYITQGRVSDEWLIAQEG